MTNKEQLQHESSWMTMTQAARLIGGVGRNKLYNFLREQGVLNSRNEPAQAHCDAGYFKVHFTGKYSNRGLFINTFPSVLVSGEGLAFIKRLLDLRASKA